MVRVTTIAWKCDWLPRKSVRVVDTLIGLTVCLVIQAGSHKSLLSQEAAIIDSLDPLLYPW